jgi:large subunit ribosomal protein L25
MATQTEKERFAAYKQSSKKEDPGNHITAEVREAFGKGAARKLRAAGKIPAVLYGHGTEPKHLSLPGHNVMLLLRKANAMIDLDIAGKSQLALVKDVQKDPVRQIIEHIDLVIIRKGEKVHVDVPVHIVGEAAPGTAIEHEAHVIEVEVPAIAIPEGIDASVEGLEAVSHVYAKDLVLPDGVTLVADPETLIVSVVVPSVTEEPTETADDDAATTDVEAAAEESAE